jgi:hypothetical protein
MTGTRCGAPADASTSRTPPDGAGQPGTVSYGLSFQAWAVFLMVMHHVPAGRCADILESMSGTLLRDPEDVAQSYPGAIWPGQIAEALPV